MALSIGLTSWQPLLDLGPDMSISALALDPTVTPATGSFANAVLVAGIGAASSAFKNSALNGIIRSWNRGAEVTFGYSASEALGRPITLIIPPDRFPEEADILARLRRAGYDPFAPSLAVPDGWQSWRLAAAALLNRF